MKKWDSGSNRIFYIHFAGIMYWAWALLQFVSSLWVWYTAQSDILSVSIWNFFPPTESPIWFFHLSCSPDPDKKVWQLVYRSPFFILWMRSHSYQHATASINTLRLVCSLVLSEQPLPAYLPKPNPTQTLTLYHIVLVSVHTRSPFSPPSPRQSTQSIQFSPVCLPTGSLKGLARGSLPFVCHMGGKI